MQTVKSPSASSSNLAEFIYTKCLYMQQIIQKTIISIKEKNKANLFSENDVNLSTSILIDLYSKLIQIQTSTDADSHLLDGLLNNLQQIIDKLSLVICGFGTKELDDLLFVSFGSDFKNMKFEDKILNDKYIILKHLLTPTGYKIMNWKGKQNIQISNNSYCLDKKSENIIKIEEMNHIECIDDDDNTNCNIYEKQLFIKCIFHNYKLKKSIVISGFLYDIPLSCITNSYTSKRITELNHKSTMYSGIDSDIFKNIISNLSLKEILVFSDNDLAKNIINIKKEVEYVKNTHIDLVVKKFLESEVETQRRTLVNLLLYPEDIDIHYVCYILYDLINVDNTSEHKTDSNIIYDSLPVRMKQVFKSIIKYNIKNTQDIMQKYETNKVNLEQQIYLLKSDDSIKEKAFAKLRDMKGKPDEMTMKTKQYLEGLVKIPFNTYYEEPIIKNMKESNQMFSTIKNNFSFLFSASKITKKNRYTNSELKYYIKQIEDEIYNNMRKRIFDGLPHCKTKTLLEICGKINYYYNKKTISTSVKKKDSIICDIKKNIPNVKNSMLCNIYNDVNQEEHMQITNLYENISNINSNINHTNQGLQNIENVLNNSIHGHSHAKKQLMKIMGQWMNGSKQGYSFGFEGSPGIGKTSLASKGLTKCLTTESENGRPFSFIAMGGSTNGSFLEGHSYTYMNSTWGRIVDILIESKCMNPIIYIDELDKVSKTEQGKEIIGILTHLIDPTQNKNFQDKYFAGINIDVSKILFIFSYNDPEQIDKILLDRIHRIKFENLTICEKITIVKKYILPEINEKMGFENVVSISNETIEYIITSYTMEPGVRKLKEILFDLYGEINLQLLQEKNSKKIPIILTNEVIDNEYLTKYSKIKEKKIHENNEIGMINGLWANSLGMGGITPIQTLFYPSSTFLQLQLTGLQGDVMKESMNVAKTLAWNLTNDKLKSEWLRYFEETKCQGLHIHCPEGGISKDGPSAGTAITTAIYSLLNKKSIKNHIAITGEITLQGNVTAIGGLDIKISSGIRAGVKTFIYPKENNREFVQWKDQQDNINNELNFIEVSHISEVLNQVFE